MATTFNYALAHQKLLAASTTQQITDELEDSTPLSSTISNRLTILPPPFFEAESPVSSLSGVVFHGASTIFLPPIELSPQAGSNDGDANEPAKLHAVQEFRLSYLPVRKGFSTVGGVRVLLVEDKYLDDNSEDYSRKDKERQRVATPLKQWEVVAEVWVSPHESI